MIAGEPVVVQGNGSADNQSIVINKKNTESIGCLLPICRRRGAFPAGHGNNPDKFHCKRKESYAKK